MLLDFGDTIVRITPWDPLGSVRIQLFTAPDEGIPGHSSELLLSKERLEYFVTELLHATKRK